LVVIVALAIGLALGIQAILVKPYQIPSGSMIPTLEKGQRVLVNRASEKLGGDPEVGDIWVFHPPKGAEAGRECGAAPVTGRGNGAEVDDPSVVTYDPADQACPLPTSGESEENFIKRVVAGPGDRLRIEGGQAIVNGVPADEPFTRNCGESGGGGCDLSEEIEIPPDHYFMMGDNRGASDDSRFWGPVPRDSFIGQAFATYWPPSRIGVF
jgi:signal peptidase I